jgi:hypothetical protein
MNTEAVPTRVPRELKDAVVGIAREHDRSTAAEVRRALAEHVVASIVAPGEGRCEPERARVRSARKPPRLRKGRRTLGGRGARRAHRRTEARGARAGARPASEVCGRQRRNGSRSVRGSSSPTATRCSSSRVATWGVSVHELVNDPVLSTMLSPWLPLFEGPLHLAREAYLLDHGGDA